MINYIYLAGERLPSFRSVVEQSETSVGIQKYKYEAFGRIHFILKRSLRLIYLSWIPTFVSLCSTTLLNDANFQLAFQKHGAL